MRLVLLSSFLCLCAAHQAAAARTVTVPVVGIFDKSSDYQQKRIFQYAAGRIFRDRSIPGIRLVPRIETIDDFDDSFLAEKRACNHTQNGVGAIFGPQTTTNTAIVKSVCETMEVPCVMTNWDLAIDQGLKMNLNLHPEPRILSKGLAAIVKSMDWKTFSVVYDKEESLMYLQDVLKLFKPSESNAPIGIYQMEEDDDHGPLLKHIKSSGETHIIVHCEPARILSLLQQAKQVKMMEEYQSYFITHLDAHTLDFEEFRSSGTNVTCVRVIDPDNDYVQNVFQDWSNEGNDLEITANTIKAEAAFMFDAVYVYARALRILKDINPIQVEQLFCDRADKWALGHSLAMSMKKLENKGLTGVSKFDEEGRRTFFSLEIVDLSQTGEPFTKIGTWDPVNEIEYVVNLEDIKREKLAEKMLKKVFIVSSRTGAPHLVRKDPNDTRTVGNELFEGYAMDLIDAISREVPFQYQFELAPANAYGKYDPTTNRWDGIMGQILERKADLAICDFTITKERERLLDFSIPFMTLGISIIFMKPEKEDPELFSFLSPFSVEVWMYMATAYLGVSLILFILARMAPGEWDNPHPCVEEFEELENTFNLCNCLWFSLGSILGQGSDLLPKISPYEWAKPHPCSDEAAEMETSMNLHNSIWHNCGSLMQQGSDIAPKAVSTRMVSGIWCVFTLIMKSYTANLTANLANNRLSHTKPIRSVEDLANQHSVKYGLISDSPTQKFFENSNHSTYQRMWAAMESTRPSVFTVDNDEGVERVRSGKRTYAFIMESTGIEYQVERHCDLQQIGGMLDSKGYGIAMPVNSPYRSKINEAILKMQEDGRLAELKEKWWTRELGGGACKESDEVKANDQELGLQNVGGVFVVLALGCLAGFFMSIMEFLWNIRKIAVEEEITPKEALIREIKFALSCSETTKPVPKKKSSSKNSSQSGSMSSVASHPQK